VWPVLERLATDLGLRTVITNDTHYTRADDVAAHDALLCIQTGSKLSDPGRFRFDSDQFFVKSAAQMRPAFPDHAHALDATLEVAERCDARIAFDLDLLPRFPTPDGVSEAEHLRAMVVEGAQRRYGSPLPSEVQERVEYELRVIEQMGFPAYFLIVADLCRHARSVGIRVGPGRGSAGGSVVAYATDITRVDPIRHGLIFERFLNPSRQQMPDIGNDFDHRLCGEMIQFAADPLKMRLWQLINGQGSWKWFVHDAVSHEYAWQMASEEATDGHWRKKRSTSQNHLWDCEVMQVVMARCNGLLEDLTIEIEA
jgi:DNA polymerase-3 subunit alpha